jgi:hypothetical protein
VKSANDTVTSRTTARDKYKKWGFNSDFGGFGYQCQPATGGYCYIRCDGGGSTTAGSYKDKLKVPDPRDSTGRATITEDHDFPTDSRCGGDNLIGYKCMPAGGSASKRNVCMRDCKTQNTDNHNRLACDYKLNLQSHGDAVPFRMSADAPAIPSHGKQQCYTSVGVTGCQWNPDFEPRNPADWDELK